MWYLVLLTLLTGSDDSYAPVKIGRGLWRSPAGFVYRSDKLFTGDELKRQEAVAGFDVGDVPPRTAEDVKVAYGRRRTDDGLSARPIVLAPRPCSEGIRGVSQGFVSSETLPVSRARTAGAASPNVGDGVSFSAYREDRHVRQPAAQTRDRQTQDGNSSDGTVIQGDCRCRLPQILESETTVAAEQRRSRTELTASVAAHSSRDKNGESKVWEARIVFESKGTQSTLWFVASMFSVVVFVVALALLGRDHFQRRSGHSASAVKLDQAVSWP